MGERHRERWNDFVAQSSHFALMQSYEWGEFKEKLGWRSIRLAVRRHGQVVAAAQLLIKRAPTGLVSVGYVPRGPLVDWQDYVTTSALLGALHGEARRHRAIFVKIEPPLLNSPEAHRQLQQYGFRVSPYCNQPRATITVDLAQDLDDILKSMRKQTRRDIGRAARKGVTVRVGGLEDLTAFCDLMQMTSRRGEFSPRARDYYQLEWRTFVDNRQAVLFKAFYREHLLAMQMACRFGDQAAAIHGVSSREHAELCPNHLLVWEAIKWSKTLGCETYDLWGIPAEVGQAVYEGRDLPKPGRTDGLWGVYHFKSGFSKNIAYYVGAYDYIYSPLLYTMVANRLFGASTLDRIAVWMDSLKHI
jgi:peptidoglycan pentaglycine glycine transferase (the first glycine)